MVEVDINENMPSIMVVVAVVVIAITLLIMTYTITAAWNYCSIFHSLRYGGGNSLRQFVLANISRLSGTCNILFINKSKDIDLCNDILKHSVLKGRGLEYWFAKPAWYPIYNMESIDGKEWMTMRKYFHMVAKKISADKLHELSCKYSVSLIEPIESRNISMLPALIFYECIFGTELPDAHYDLFYAASVEWRKQIALKGKGNITIKNALIKYIVEAVASSNLDRILKIAVYNADPYAISAIIQPFFISPMINYSDIFVAIYQYKDKFNHISNKEEVIAFIMEAIRLNHPFPILERHMTKDINIKDRFIKKNTHVYIELDVLEQDPVFDISKWMLDDKYATPIMRNIYGALPFGAGQRACPGKNFALITLVPIFIELLSRRQVYPQRGHLYSGRDNDGAITIFEAIYLLKTLVKTYINIVVG